MSFEAAPNATAKLTELEGRDAVRFERRLAHPPERVWRAITDRGELEAWFPADIEGDLGTVGRRAALPLPQRRGPDRGGRGAGERAAAGPRLHLGRPDAPLRARAGRRRAPGSSSPTPCPARRAPRRRPDGSSASTTSRRRLRRRRSPSRASTRSAGRSCTRATPRSSAWIPRPGAREIREMKEAGKLRLG